LLDKAQGWFRLWFAKVWSVRGGSLYAVGYALTFVYLEVRTVIVEFIEADSIGSFFSEQLSGDRRMARSVLAWHTCCLRLS
jgi:hypothetical protein